MMLLFLPACMLLKDDGLSQDQVRGSVEVERERTMRSVPVGTPVEEARLRMEMRGFKCSMLGPIAPRGSTEERTSARSHEADRFEGDLLTGNAVGSVSVLRGVPMACARFDQGFGCSGETRWTVYLAVAEGQVGAIAVSRDWNPNLP